MQLQLNAFASTTQTTRASSCTLYTESLQLMPAAISVPTNNGAMFTSIALLEAAATMALVEFTQVLSVLLNTKTWSKELIHHPMAPALTFPGSVAS